MMLTIPKRTEKPRKTGITSVHDVGIPLQELQSILNDYHTMIDIAKFGVGSAYVAPNLEAKIQLYKENGVQVYFGGTLFEKFYYQNKIEDYISFMKSNGVDMVEVSTGTISLSLDDRLRVIDKMKNNGFQVLAEVGSKDQEKIMSPSLWIEEINQLLEAGCEYVITEGRNSGTAGVYRPSGEIRMGLIDDILKEIGYKKIIFEAPTSKAQMYFITKVNANVNLGNINPRDLLLLEAQRCGLRSETFYL